MGKGVEGFGARAIVKHYVTDTHALLWYLTDSPLLSKAASAAFDEADAGHALIYIPAIVAAELYFVIAKLKLPLDFAAEINRLRQSGQFEFVPFTVDDTLDFKTDEIVPEMHDRIIVGVARRLNAACLTRDPAIATSRLAPVVW